MRWGGSEKKKKRRRDERETGRQIKKDRIKRKGSEKEGDWSQWGGSSRPGLLPARTRHDVLRGRGWPGQPVVGVVLGAGIRGQFRGKVSRIAARARLGCFPPSFPGRCFCLYRLVTHHCSSSSQNCFLFKCISWKFKFRHNFMSLLLNGLESPRGLYGKVFLIRYSR